MSSNKVRERNIKEVQRFLRSVASKRPEERKQLAAEFTSKLNVSDPEEINLIWKEAAKRNQAGKKTGKAILGIFFAAVLLAAGYFIYQYITGLRSEITGLNLAQTAMAATQVAISTEPAEVPEETVEVVPTEGVEITLEPTPTIMMDTILTASQFSDPMFGKFILPLNSNMVVLEPGDFVKAENSKAITVAAKSPASQGSYLYSTGFGKVTSRPFQVPKDGMYAIFVNDNDYSIGPQTYTIFTSEGYPIKVTKTLSVTKNEWELVSMTQLTADKDIIISVNSGKAYLDRLALDKIVFIKLTPADREILEPIASKGNLIAMALPEAPVSTCISTESGLVALNGTAIMRDVNCPEVVTIIWKFPGDFYPGTYKLKVHLPDGNQADILTFKIFAGKVEVVLSQPDLTLPVVADWGNLGTFTLDETYVKGTKISVSITIPVELTGRYLFDVMTISIAQE